MSTEKMSTEKMSTEKKTVQVKGKRMAYVEAGSGDPIVFLHGNPTSSYLWRNIIPHLADQGRCLAPDLIGMGDSEKLSDSGPGSYRLVEHREDIDGLLDELGVRENVTFVVHDWGSALGFDWARRHAHAIKGIAHMEAIAAPREWADFGERGDLFRMLRSPAGDAAVLEKNFFVEKMLPGAIMRKLSDEEMNEYRRPFLTPGEDRRPTLTWPREIPIGGEPADVVRICQDYSAWMAANDIPKFFVNVEPGAIVTGKTRAFCRTWKNQTEITVEGVHFVQEDHPDAIGKGIRDWYRGLG